nr:unnamed protein product [Haemonchus contortus]
MILLRQHLKASLVSFIFLLQVRQALFCTFTENPHHSGVWASYISLIKIVTLNSTGACLKMCLEEIPECINVGVQTEAENMASLRSYAERRLYTASLQTRRYSASDLENIVHTEWDS